jgi:hypothetical protein
MKKLSLILAGALLLGGISFASPLVKKQAQKAPVAKPGPVKPVAKPVTKPTTKPKGGDVPPTHRKGSSVKPAAK